MFFSKVYIIALVLQLLLQSIPAAAQTAPAQPFVGMDEFRRLWGYPPLTLAPQIEGPLPLPQVGPGKTTHDHPGPHGNEEKRLSYWGYRHHEAHKKGLVHMLHKLTNSKCCDGPDSGECRISTVDMPAKKVMIDGEWCPYDNTTKVAVLEGLESMRDGDATIALVCAGQTNRIAGTERRQCVSVYCIGILPVRM